MQYRFAVNFGTLSTFSRYYSVVSDTCSRIVDLISIQNIICTLICWIFLAVGGETDEPDSGGGHGRSLQENPVSLIFAKRSAYAALTDKILYVLCLKL